MNIIDISMRDLLIGMDQLLVLNLDCIPHAIVFSVDGCMLCGVLPINTGLGEVSFVYQH